MNNKGIIIWLVLLTVYTGYQDFILYSNWESQKSNLEIRKQRTDSLKKYLNETLTDDINEQFKILETYINEEIKNRFEYNEKFLHEH